MSWPGRIAEEIARQGPVVRVTVIRAEGSTPREIGAAMLVDAAQTQDTIGGGALEFEAIAHARGLLARSQGAEFWQREWRDFALGPSLGQCCGGFVRLMFELFTEREREILESLGHATDPPPMVMRRVENGAPLEALPTGDESGAGSVGRAAKGLLAPGRVEALLIPGRKGEPDVFLERLAPSATPLLLYGAGHVGRALARVLEGLPFAITWIDVDASRFPQAMPHAVVHTTTDPAALAETAPPGAAHLVMTHSHPLDLAICHAVLSHGDFRYLGLIGSETKRARFAKRLRELGHAQAELARLVCPIGLPSIEGKQPEVIAISIAAQLLTLRQ
jgi:xanthine dehydrogenase accessory factor